MAGRLYFSYNGWPSDLGKLIVFSSPNFLSLLSEASSGDSNLRLITIGSMFCGMEAT
jgi:hypothetical protein